MKYTTVMVSGIVINVAIDHGNGYTEGIIECFLPDETKMTAKEEKEWIKKNNIRMKAICNFMNQNNL